MSASSASAIGILSHPYEAAPCSSPNLRVDASTTVHASSWSQGCLSILGTFVPRRMVFVSVKQDHIIVILKNALSTNDGVVHPPRIMATGQGHIDAYVGVHSPPLCLPLPRPELRRHGASTVFIFNLSML